MTVASIVNRIVVVVVVVVCVGRRRRRQVTVDECVSTDE